MKIDLHCHTKKTKEGDPITRNVDRNTFTQKIINADVHIVAITNHNHFDINQYTDFSESTKDICQIWPGIELDVESTTQKRWHLILIANPISVDMFNSLSEQLISKKNPDECIWRLSEIYEKAKDCDVLYIPHFHKKPGIPEEDIDELNNLVHDKWRIFREAPNLKSLSIFANHSINTLIGSDVQNWENYENSSFAELRLPVESYDQFCQLAQKNEPVINSLLNQKNSHNIEACPYQGVKIPLKLYEDINVIFGQKGTGKSEMLKSLKANFTVKGLRCKEYFGSQKEDDFKNLLGISDMKRDSEIVSAETCEEEFHSLFKWEDTKPTHISNYEKWIKTKNNSKNKQRLKIAEAVKEPFSKTSEFEQTQKDYNTITASIKKIAQIKLDTYLSDKELTLLNDMLKRLEERIKERLTSYLFNKITIQLLNFSIDKIKELADKKTDSISKPSTTGYLAFTANRLALYKSANKICINTTEKKSSERLQLGELEDKGPLYIQKCYRMLCGASVTNEFISGIRNLRAIKEIITNISTSFYRYDINDPLASLRELCDKENVKSSNSFLGLSKCIVTEDNQQYQPSTGEKGILLLQNSLQQDADVYILDEPELGMGNSYIDSTIRPQIQDLAKRRKVVVVATHNANIAVRTRPYVSIYRVHKNGNYITYIGNPFADKLININDPNDKKSWTNESMHTLEGGKSAFYERKSIYESGD